MSFSLQLQSFCKNLADQFQTHKSSKNRWKIQRKNHLVKIDYLLLLLLLLLLSLLLLLLLILLLLLLLFIFI